MKKRVVSIFNLLLLSLMLLLPLATAQGNAALDGLNEAAGQVSAYDTSKSYNNFLQTKAGQIVGIVLSFIGILFLILIIFAGISWMTANGNQEKVTKAKGLMINAIIGVIIIFAAYAITSFIGNQVLK